MTCTADSALHPGVVEDAGDGLGEPAEERRQHGPADRAVGGERKGGRPSRARDALLQHVPAYLHCRPDSALGLLEKAWSAGE
ncbi:hypothetical protein [Streptomyces eurythermus]|uniref:hypothetical protein n=1 Tax=Streptomyces eurythermus TaxID=42237 RepID=UPI0036FC8E7F